MRQLGFPLGTRNRVAQWQKTEAPAPPAEAPSREEATPPAPAQGSCAAGDASCQAGPELGAVMRGVVSEEQMQKLASLTARVERTGPEHFVRQHRSFGDNVTYTGGHEVTFLHKVRTRRGQRARATHTRRARRLRRGAFVPRHWHPAALASSAGRGSALCGYRSPRATGNGRFRC